MSSECEVCGCVLPDNYYYLSYAHSKQNEESHLFICEQCMYDVKDFLTRIAKGKIKLIEKTFDKKTYSVSFELPDGYSIIRGSDDEEQ